jgi:two-component system response regulator ResD
VGLELRRSVHRLHVRRLREKIEDDAARPRLISTVWGTGNRYDGDGTLDDGDGTLDDGQSAG